MKDEITINYRDMFSNKIGNVIYIYFSKVIGSRKKDAAIRIPSEGTIGGPTPLTLFINGKRIPCTSLSYSFSYPPLKLSSKYDLNCNIEYYEVELTYSN